MGKIILAINTLNAEKADIIFEKIGNMFDMISIAPELPTAYFIIERAKDNNVKVLLNSDYVQSWKVYEMLMNIYEPIAYRGKLHPYDNIHGLTVYCYPHVIDAIRRAKDYGRKLLKIDEEILPKIYGVVFSTQDIMERTRDEIIETTLKRIKRVNEKDGLDGVVVSGYELEPIRKEFPELETILTAIRSEKYSVKNDDQVRIVMAEEAKKLNPDYYLIGRPITEAKDMKEAAEYFKKLIEM